MREAGAALVGRAQAAGALRADIDVTDLLKLGHAIAMAAERMTPTAPARPTGCWRWCWTASGAAARCRPREHRRPFDRYCQDGMPQCRGPAEPLPPNRGREPERHRPPRHPGRPRAQPEEPHLELPRERLIVFTGLSGSGKSSLAFDTIYAEGQRRYVESLSAYARQFLGQMDKPDVDFIEGLSPAISIDQKTASRNPRSTVGTVTEIHDYLRLMWARIGIPHCPNVRRARWSARPPSRSSTRSWSFPRAPASRCWPRWCGAARASTRPAQGLPAKGFARARIDGEIRELTEAIRLDRYYKHSIEVVVDRLVARGEAIQPSASPNRSRRPLAPGRGGGRDRAWSTRADELSRSPNTWPARTTASRSRSWPRATSRSTPLRRLPASAPESGSRYEVDPELVVPDPDLPVPDGAIAPWSGPADRRVLRPAAGAAGRAAGSRPRHPVGEAAPKKVQRGHPLRHRDDRSRSATRTATAAPGPTRPLRGSRPLPHPPLRRGRVRRRPGADRGVHAGGALLGL